MEQSSSSGVTKEARVTAVSCGGVRVALVHAGSSRGEQLLHVELQGCLWWLMGHDQAPGGAPRALHEPRSPRSCC